MSDYASFLAAKRPIVHAVGRSIDDSDMSPVLFPFQRMLVKWAVPKGRAALLPDAGMGKTPMQLEWARLTDEKALILAPLTVARQTVKMAEELLGIEVRYAREQSEATGQITVTNYEMLHRFDPGAFGAVVLDESSILKATAGAYRNKLVDAFRNTRYRLCCSATPAPNDIQEITNHSAFLGVMARRDVLATFFVHASDDARSTGWRLKAHARPAFWRWFASWAMALKKPSDIGFSDDGYELPELRIKPVIVEAEVKLSGRLFADKLHGVGDRAAVRRQTADARVNASLELVERERNEPWIIWCGLNDEQAGVSRELGDDCISVTGSMPAEQKAELIEAWQDGQSRVLVSKVPICGFGMNLQRAARMAFVGLSDSYEQYYQAVRRCWRFGQTRPVSVYVVLSEIEEAIFDNVLRKEREAEEMAAELVKHVAAFERAELVNEHERYEYAAEQSMRLPAWIGAN